MKASPSSSLPKGKGGFDLFYGLNIAQRRKGCICSPRASTSLKGKGGIYLFIFGASMSLEGEEDLSVLSLVPQRRSRARRTYLFYGLNITRGRGGLILPALDVHARGETCSGCPQRV